MDRLINIAKSHASGLDSFAGVARYGLVSSFDPSCYAVRVSIQPENVLTGWLPILTAWVGSGWGMAAPVLPGTQVIVLPMEGNNEQGVVIGGLWSNVDTPIQVAPGEFQLLHSSGSCVYLKNDGSVEIQAPTVNVIGNLVVSGDISDRSGTHGTLDALRITYDGHTHPLPQNGNTYPPSEVI
jgi:phage baseplate assembly protein V